MESKKRTRFYDWSINEIAKNQHSLHKKTIGIHACCAPCSLFPIEFLYPTFHLVILYSNANIYPENEYEKRKNELIKYLELFNQDKDDKIELVLFDYDHETYMKDLNPLKYEKEGGQRCSLCYKKRMSEAYKYAYEHKYDYFTTVMSISRQKNAEKLNEIGHKLEQKYLPTKYFYSDFKKKNGDLKAHQLKKKYNLYNQLYCGCEYSYQAYLAKINKQK